MTDEKKCNYGRQIRPGIQIDKPCNRLQYDGEHCIFHSEDIEGKKNKFNVAFWKEFGRQKKDEEKYDFYGFVFTGEISFGEKELEKEADFGEAQFYGGANFGEAQFSGGVDFWAAQFFGVANFWKAKFSGGANFKAAKFLEGALFREAQFSRGANFEAAQFSGAAGFGAAQFSLGALFREAKFSGEALFGEAKFSGMADFREAQFSGMANFEATQFSGMADFGVAHFSEWANFEAAQFFGEDDFALSTFSGEELRGLFASLRNKGIKRILKGRYKIKDFRFHLGEKIAKEYPMIDRMTKDAWYVDDFENNHPFIYALWNITAKCGHGMGRWIFWSIFFALYFAFNFYLIDCAFPTAFSFNEAIQEKSFWSFIYYSMVTFTTLGFGDIIPTLVWVQRWVMAEVIIGYIMLGGLISILANKLARRS
jgi:uncharacterized protein YjbI with pentapeptide repeats